MSSYVGNDGDWDWSYLALNFPSHVIVKIHAILPPDTNGQLDRISWAFSNNGTFSMKLAYQHLANNNPP